MVDPAPDWSNALVELIEKVALLRESIKKRGDDEHYAARTERIAQKLEALARAIESGDPAMATAVRSAWARPVRSLAFRNAVHQKGRDD